MEPQNNTQFTGTPQSKLITFDDGPKTNGPPWRTISIITIVLIAGVTAGLVFFMMQANENSKDANDAQIELNAAIDQLNRFKEATGADKPENVIPGGEFDFSEIADFLKDTKITLEKAFIQLSEDGKFQIARFFDDKGVVNFFYRALPTGEWKRSDYNDQSVPYCVDLLNEEIEAFRGIKAGPDGAALDCNKEKPEPEEGEDD